jgi:hypothetical protein
MPVPLSPVDAKELIRLCEAGRLYEIEAWIRAGRSLSAPTDFRKTPLNVALSTGFHSLIELLLRHEESQERKNEVLREALLMKKPAFIDLALAHGAEVASVPFLDVLMGVTVPSSRPSSNGCGPHLGPSVRTRFSSAARQDDDWIVSGLPP